VAEKRPHHETDLPQAFLTLLEEAKHGSATALGTLIEECRCYLLSVANQELPEKLRAKVAPSDMVQDSCLEAQLAFQQFRGQSRDELVNWLRTILLFNISNARRRYCDTAKRQLHREFSLDDLTDQSNAPWQLAACEPSPSQAAIRHEDEARIEKAIEQLPDHFRQAVLLRQREHLTFGEIGQRMNRSAEATRKLWARGIEQLQQILAGEAEPADERRN
jgi:RNA polymerase sigma-70 factor (ECF subfamily)